MKSKQTISLIIVIALLCLAYSTSDGVRLNKTYRMAQSDNADKRLMATEQLCQFGYKAEIPMSLVIPLLEDEDSRIVKKALFINPASKEKYTTFVRCAQNSHNPCTRREVIAAICNWIRDIYPKTGPSDYILPVLKAGLQDHDINVVMVTIKQLDDLTLYASYVFKGIAGEVKDGVHGDGWKENAAHRESLRIILPEIVPLLKVFD